MTDWNNGLTKGRVLNFGAGPGCLPEEVLITAQNELLNFQGSGKSIMELSHRGKEFTKVIEETKANLKLLLKVPDNYDILFLQGGATSLFAGIPLNLCDGPSDTIDFLVTGAWSKAAYNEAKLYTKANAVIDMESSKFLSVVNPAEWKFSEKPAYIHYCDNETVHGIEMPTNVYEYTPAGVPIVCDMSSNFLSKPVDVSKYGVIFAGAQKNAGIAGITIVIARHDLISRSKPNVPNVFNFLKKSQQNSLDNTPPTFNIYITGLVLKWLIKNGGLEAADKRNQEKADLLYKTINESNDFYCCYIDEKYRSKMNVCFRIKGGDNDLEEKFFKQAEQNGISDIKGHRSVGGIRVSLYNAMTLQGTEILINFMKKFMSENK
ncbi:phosphoserine transaminase [Heterostelium album PN500]|uniref:Phosphoserine aminotransferase n=1 Tax=Heterostelium pallidum (strain ATCC 26659 / Pp 5 / PN500) TaxID=670386 RepID=D3AY60_HETP5|nr:phosphoserine transaminase [Heterostelium album PN500]EFA85887.1 phosphoserine transaminase [Heterostelium album PN500]|eukprot:XP_020437993.1 phosphoserine transaminase [Heterostelium album PN500]